MDNQVLPYDGKAVRALIQHWAYEISGEDPAFVETFADLAGYQAIGAAALEATEAGVSLELGVVMGIEYGIALALAVVNAGMSGSARKFVQEAIDDAKRELDDLTRVALDDQKLKAVT